MSEKKIRILTEAGLSERTASSLASIYSIEECRDCAALVRRLKAEEEAERRLENA